jgi:hypothetical protein
MQVLKRPRLVLPEHEPATFQARNLLSHRQWSELLRRHKRLADCGEWKGHACVDA